MRRERGERERGYSVHEAMKQSIRNIVYGGADAGGGGFDDMK